MHRSQKCQNQPIALKDHIMNFVQKQYEECEGTLNIVKPIVSIYIINEQPDVVIICTSETNISAATS